MAGNAFYDVGLRVRAAELHDGGRGRTSVAPLLGIPEEAARGWLDTYGSVGIGVLTLMGAKKTPYPFETKPAAVRAIVDGGMTKPEAMARFGIASTSSFKKWLRAYREGGPRRRHLGLGAVSRPAIPHVQQTAPPDGSVRLLPFSHGLSRH